MLLGSGISHDTSPIGMMEAYLYPSDVRLASSGQGFIVTSGCGIYFEMVQDELASDIFTASAEKIDTLQSKEGVWNFYILNQAGGVQFEVQEPIERWANGLALVNHEIQGDFAPGQTLKLIYRWKVESAPEQIDYHFFNHLIDGDGQLATQVDGASVHPVYWRQEDQLINQFYLTLPEDLPSGEYSLQIGMYSWPDIVRVPIAGSEETNLQIAAWRH